MPNELFLKIGGIYHLLCALLHVFFPRLLRWENNLKGLSVGKKTIIKQSLHIMNICLLLFWLILAYIPLFYANELLETQLGKAVLTSIVFFWVVRIFVLQPVFIGIKTRESWRMSIFFLLGFMFFFIPWVGIIL
ncbi:MAG TPA: hypothetical protein VMX75_15115 [Spirochaetia bacterium]|nr:hypothetical protein [Spirochaetia bacterium]